MPYTLELPAQPTSGGYTLELPQQDLAAAQKAASSADAARAIALRSVVGSAFPMLGGTYAPDVAMGGIQDILGPLQALAHIGGPSVVSDAADSANKAANDFYASNFRPEDQPGSTIARGMGQGLPAMLMPGAAAGGIIRSTTAGAGLGAAQGALSPVDNPADFWSQKADQAKTGAMFGAGAGAAGNVLGRMISPNVSDAQKTLLDAGVGLTPGQAAGGVFKGIEDRLAGFPVIGDIIKSAQFRGITDFNRAVYAKALEPFGEEGAKVAAKAEVGNEGIKTVGDFLSQKYRDVLPQVSVKVDQPFIQSMGELSQMAANLPPDRQAQFVSILNNEVKGRMTPAGLMNGESMKAADSALGRIASNYRGSSVGDERTLGSAVAQAQQNLRDMVARQNPDTAPLIAAADQGWRTLTQMENAGAMLGAKDGIFTPSQFLNAVKKSDKTVRDRAFARGDAYNQDFARAADSVLPNKVPDSGTAGRIVGPMLLAEHGASMEPLTMGALALGAAPYTSWLGPLVSSALTSRTQPLQTLGAFVKRFAPALAFPASASAQ